MEAEKVSDYDDQQEDATTGENNMDKVVQDEENEELASETKEDVDHDEQELSAPEHEENEYSAEADADGVDQNADEDDENQQVLNETEDELNQQEIEEGEDVDDEIPMEEEEGPTIDDEHEQEEDKDDVEGDSEMSETNNNENDGATNITDEQQIVGSVKRKRSASLSSTDEGPQRKQGRSGSINANERHDTYCWVCHREGVQAKCKICPRSFHFKCMHLPDEKTNQNLVVEQASCICPECAVVMNAENTETRSDAMKQLTIDQLISMLKHACHRMQSLPGVEPFSYPVDPDDAVDYFKFIKYPMDLSTLEENVKKRQYGSTEAFLADAQWLVHNSIVFNSGKPDKSSSPFTTTAKRILKTCKQEIQEIETCPECYVNAHQQPSTWFTEACKRPHVLVWAKLKGFPFWPAKAMKIKDELVDVRFFGAHDRAWVVRRDCYLYSDEMPGASPKRNNAFIAAIEELNAHIEKLKENHGEFVRAPHKTLIGPTLSVEQIRQMLPDYKPEEPSGTPSGSKSVAAAKRQPPMTIRISSLKTNPTIVNNSIVEESSAGNGRPTLRTRKSGLASPLPPNDKAVPSSDATVDAAEIENDENEQTEIPQEAEAESEDGEANVADTSEGILASVLGTRPTRRTSLNRAAIEVASVATEDQNSSSAIPTTERRMTRSANKSTSSANESGDETTPDGHPPPSDSFLASIGLRKASDVANTKPKTTTVPALGKLLHPSQVFVKEEVMDDEMDDGGGSSGEATRGAIETKSKDLLNQMSLVPKKSTGMRFNLSKDISISPVGEDPNMDKADNRIRRPMIQGHNARLLPGLIPQNMQMSGNRSRPGVNGGMSRAPGQQGRLMTRPQRPGLGGGQMRPIGMKMSGHHRPQLQQTMNMKSQGIKKDQNPTLVVESSSLRMDGYSTNALQLNQVQSLQGAITLPGGTITVTPLAPVIGVPITTTSYSGDMNGGHVVALKQGISSTGVTNANGVPISVIAPHEGNSQSLLKSNKTPNQRRNLINQVPPSVGHLVQNLQKNLVETVKSTMEQIVVEMLENAPNASGGPEMKALKDENDKLRKQLNEQKHHHDIALRDLKIGMENERKRALNEIRRQAEQDKMKAIDEAKKKQWCARCGREAQFYCCWNTSYCGYPCQEDHWPAHMNSCSQSSGNAGARNQ